ncbi:uncharacterized protein LOC112555804 [Pomacea canaliculata]|uniref:uncharacterized protein LOC112555804 n=1 Tax=Pomacea canaliculata TaxID=400727 RepID=UPI000D726011|nr:uncharacterized protein LOC112555804 [Pomacea canaliculata]
MEQLCLLIWIITGILLSLTLFTDCLRCPQYPPSTASVNETDPPVHFLANLTYDPVLIWKVELSSKPAPPAPSDPGLRNWTVQEAVLIHLDAGRVNLVLNQTLDLEYIYDRWGYKMFLVQLALKCLEPGLPDVSYEFFLTVEPVNEFYPEFLGDPFVLYIPENTSVDTTVITLKNNATDRDVVVRDAGDIFSFTMVVSQPNSIVDGGTLFTMKYSINGTIVVKSTLDFERFPAGSSASVVFNVSARDQGGLTNQTTLTIHILDSDDLPPVFYYPGCTGGCSVGSYKASITSTQTGVVTNISPGNITARDGDTLGFAVSYSIKHDLSTQRYTNNLHINSSTGEFSIIKPLGVVNDSEILLTIEATEISHQSRSSIKSLLLKIPDNSVPLNTTPTPEKPTNGDKEENTVIIIVIVLAVVVAVVLVALVVLTVLVRKFSKKAIHPKEKQPQDTGSEGSQDVLTKQGDINSTDSGQMFASTAALHMISNGSVAPEQSKLLRGGRKWRRRGSTSSPRSENSGGDDNTADDRTSSTSRLYDSGTISSVGFQNESLYDTPTFANGFAQTGELDDERYVPFPAIHLPGQNQDKKSHRRSRKQKKLEQAQRIKEEEFDGTKSYPMDADPTFFTEAKKTKVKLSTRRKPNTGLDPKFWLTVDNDFMD